jgi:signal transduction histidine kinase
MTATERPVRRGLFVAEVGALGVTTVVDSVLAVGYPQGGGWTASLLGNVVPYVGTAVAVLAVLRRRFPARIGRLAAAVVGFSLFSTAGGVVVDLLGASPVARPIYTEVLAVVLVVGAGSRRLRPLPAAVLAVAAGVAVVAAPVVRYGIDSSAALLAVPAALAWGAALAVGLILRDADARRRADLQLVRSNERLQLARELHDLVTHHVSGIVVRAQAARALTGRGDEEPETVYGEIEEAGAAALVAMRRLVGMLRDDQQALPVPGATFSEIVHDAAGSATVEMTPELAALPAPAELSSTVHRVVLESMTNARRHGTRSGAVVTVHVDRDDLVLDVANAPAPGPQRPPGYGIIGMRERVSALGGTLETGVRADGRWHTTARLPLVVPADQLPRGV